MKTTVRIALVMVIATLLVPLAGVFAQGGEGLAGTEVSAVYVVEAASGSFDGMDDAYTVMLEGVGADVLWISTAPEAGIRRLSAESVFDVWAYSSSDEYEGDEVVATAVLETGNLNIMLEMSNPMLDGENLSFEATVMNITEAEESKDGPAVPETFDAASLAIIWTAELQTNLFAAREARLEGLRDPDDPACVEAKQIWDEYYSWLTTYLRPAYNEAIANGETALADELANEAADRNAAARPYMLFYYSATCQ